MLKATQEDPNSFCSACTGELPDSSSWGLVAQADFRKSQQFDIL